MAPLDEPQRRIVETVEGVVVVAGGPGTGKTRILVHHLAYLCAVLEVAPRRILAFTWSSRGAEELRTRAQRLLGGTLHGTWIDTPYGIAQRILKGVAPDLTLIGDVEARTLVSQVARRAGVDLARHPPARIVAAISAAKARGTPPEGSLGAVYAAYQEALLGRRLLDKDDVLARALDALRKDVVLRDRLRRRFEHVLVDELQELSAPQLQLVLALHADVGHLVAVGDEDQMLGDGCGTTELAGRLGVDASVLTRSYRSSSRILYVAGRVIRHNHGGATTGPVVETMRRRGARVVCATFGDELEEAAGVVRWVKLLWERGSALLTRTAILMRQDVLARPFEEALRRCRVPYLVASGKPFYERREVRDVLSYLRLAVGGGDAEALACIANVPRRGIGPASVKTIARLQHAFRISMAEAALRAAQLPRVTARRAGALADLGRMLLAVQEAARRSTLPELIDFVVARAGYEGLLGELPVTEEEKRREGIAELRGLARAFAGPATEALPQLLERAAPGPRSARPDGVRLLTYPDAKGGEFDVVFLTGMEEGVFPSARSLAADERAIEAERRLSFIGMTRARDRLIFTRALSRTVQGQRIGGGPSRFLAEAGRRVRWFRLGSARPGVSRGPAVEPVPPSSVPSLNIVREGQRVNHPRYGAGVVTRVSEASEGGDGMVTVRFDAAGEKRLMLALARLAPE